MLVLYLCLLISNPSFFLLIDSTTSFSICHAHFLFVICKIKLAQGQLRGWVDIHVSSFVLSKRFFISPIDVFWSLLYRNVNFAFGTQELLWLNWVEMQQLSLHLLFFHLVKLFCFLFSIHECLLFCYQLILKYLLSQFKISLILE